MAFLEMTLKCWIVFGYDISLVLDLWMEKSRNIEFQQMTSEIRPSATGNLIYGLQVMGTTAVVYGRNAIVSVRIISPCMVYEISVTENLGLCVAVQ